MTEFSCFIIGLIFGIIAMAFFVLIHSIGAKFREIEWHDFKKESPNQYILHDESGNPYIQVLVHYSNSAIAVTAYYPDVPHVRRDGFPEILHFAYLEEIYGTIPKNIK